MFGQHQWPPFVETAGFLPQVVMDWGADITPTAQTHKKEAVLKYRGGRGRLERENTDYT